LVTSSVAPGDLHPVRFPFHPPHLRLVATTTHDEPDVSDADGDIHLRAFHPPPALPAFPVVLCHHPLPDDSTSIPPCVPPSNHLHHPPPLPPRSQTFYTFWCCIVRCIRWRYRPCTHRTGLLDGGDSPTPPSFGHFTVFLHTRIPPPHTPVGPAEPACLGSDFLPFLAGRVVLGSDGLYPTGWLRFGLYMPLVEPLPHGSPGRSRFCPISHSDCGF